jgi:prephenate dehydrogenase
MIRLSPEEHDRMVAVISHSPHLAASALALNFAQLVSADDAARKIVGEGFRDTTRVAAGDARMWRDICLDNRGALAGALNDLINTLNTFRDHIQQGNGQAIEDLLNQAREIRLSVHNNTS